ncbi:hypothetical protein KC343_g3560 [Hortaea werneckii]|uniref:Tat pathway signal sequence n=1 Tax=Hortaea werneckii TaxID=91943 RepID=A0A3M7EW65_HORWE|nr:hypothetical protein KC352_g10133 [Hortaea werneckii]KAI7569629.1 hypothetical protein KC317_g3160 [Hortaea werneckii]KAI7621706.1 hypothetical protein KC346_g3534 [Hortaea werneckii]KAI7632294.1 hypothetical protein KC343_g3560 [Hortaea werneckii]KAI7671764.1 hypothetical protein KC319_g5486 [Hortaea werneckii]
MPIFNGKPSNPTLNSSLRLPAQKRISLPTSQRLSTITEGPNASSSQTIRGPLIAEPSSKHEVTLGRQSQDTTKTGPPAYEWIPEPIDANEDLRAPVEGEKLAALRRNRSEGRQRGGWVRLGLVIGIAALVVIGLAVGLGVGLTIKNDQKNPDDSRASNGHVPGSTEGGDDAPPFPLGEYSLVTALHAVNTSCTPNPATWRCYPYSVYDSSDPTTADSSMATFNWILSNTSAVYLTNDTTDITPAAGIPANLTISSTNNPFSVTFTNETLTYINEEGNSTSARLTFSFQMHKSVIPSASITSNNAATQCYFNSTTFVGTMYLNARSSYPASNAEGNDGAGGHTRWPYAVEIQQSSPGGQHVPTCYETYNGQLGDEVLTVGDAQPDASQCLCSYRNYG